MESTQVAIVGAGPIGVELAIALKQAGVDYLQFDAGQVGQTISWYPRQARFFSSPERIAIAGVPLQTPDQAKASREEYLTYLRSVVEQFHLKVRTFERVTSIIPTPGRNSGMAAGVLGKPRTSFILRTHHAGGDREYQARYVVLAIGDMHGPRLLGVPGEDLPHVSHYFNEPHPFFQKNLLIVGGRNSAVEAAIRCYRAGARVTLSHRSEGFDEKAIKYWLLPEMQWLLKTRKIAHYPLTTVRKITPTHVALASPKGAPEAEVEADFVLLLTGYVMDPRPFEMAGVTLAGENRAPVCDEATMETNIPGLFVAGTAAAGTQLSFRLFIENCHIHVRRIVAAITGQPDSTPLPAPTTAALET